MDKRGGVSRFSFEFFLSHSAEKFRRRILLCCFRSFPLAKKFMDNRGGGRRGGKEYQDFPSKICLTVPKIFVGEPFCAVFQKVYGREKFMDKREGGISRFSFKSFSSDGAEKFRRGTL